MLSLSEEDIACMSNDALCERMERVLIKILSETYGDQIAGTFPRSSCSYKRIQSLSQPYQRKALLKGFEYLLQIE